LKKSIILISKEEIQMERELYTGIIWCFFELYAQELGSSTNHGNRKVWGRISQARQSSGRTPISEFTFGTYGLVILDDDADLKRPLFLQRTTTPNIAVLETTEKLKGQHTGKRIWFVYIEDKIKENFVSGKYKINNTKIEFSRKSWHYRDNPRV
jgi:hypothetical protein